MSHVVVIDQTPCINSPDLDAELIDSRRAVLLTVRSRHDETVVPGIVRNRSRTFELSLVARNHKPLVNHTCELQ